MESNWLSLLVQVPLVGVFIWYSLEMNKRMTQAQNSFMDALDKRDDAFEKRNNAVITTIDRLNESISAQLAKIQEQNEEHDRFARESTSRARSKG